MVKPQSYPFLAIAKRYRLDYGDVLKVADHWRRNLQGIESERTTPSLHNALLWPHEALGEITFANADFRAIQAGRIDWQTGNIISGPDNPMPGYRPDPEKHAKLAVIYGNPEREPEPGEHYSENYDLARFRRGEPNE